MKLSTGLLLVSALANVPTANAQQPVELAPNASLDRPMSAALCQWREAVKAMEPFVRQARATYPAVRTRFYARLPAGHTLFITTRLRDVHGREEQVFVAVDTIAGARIRGRIWSDIRLVAGYRHGQSYSFQDSALVDWMIAKPDGSEEGNVVGKFLDTSRPPATCGESGPPAPFESIDDAIAAVLRERPNWRLGTNADCTNEFLAKKLSEDPAYQAYKLTADLTLDGTRDHAFVLMRGDSAAIYWAQGRDRGVERPVLLRNLQKVTDAGLAAKENVGMLALGRFYSDYGLFWYWNRITRRLELDDEDKPVISDTTIILGQIRRDLTGDGDPEDLTLFGFGWSTDSLDVTLVIESRGRLLYRSQLRPLTPTNGPGGKRQPRSSQEHEAYLAEYGSWFFGPSKFMKPLEFERSWRAMAPRRVDAIPSTLPKEVGSAADTLRGAEVWREMHRIDVTIFEFSPGGDGITAIAWSPTHKRFLRLVECC